MTATVRARRVAFRIERALGRLAPLLTVVPRSGAAALWASSRPSGRGIPAAPLTARAAGEGAVDELMIAVQTLVREGPEPPELEVTVRRAQSIGAALAGLAPADIHDGVDPVVVSLEAGRRRLMLSWESLTYEVPAVVPAPLARWSPWLAEPGARTAQARILRHAGAPRPWVIVVHGAEQGTDLDLVMMRARHLHEDLGLNVAMPVLPLHGPRRLPGHSVPGFDIATNVSFALVAVAEIRALRRWIRRQGGDPAVALHGMSLGGYLAALTAGVEPDLDLVIAGIPMVSMHRLMARHAVRSASRNGRRIGTLLRSDGVRSLERFVDPLQFEPAVPVERRLVIAGLVDRVTTPHQALQLWRHWGEPEIIWYPGGHVGHAWSGVARERIDHALSTLEGRSAAPRAGETRATAQEVR